jgi:sodium/hydrogen antiporter
MNFIHTDDVSVVIAVLGGFIISFGLVSFFVKERLYLSEARKYMKYVI